MSKGRICTISELVLKPRVAFNHPKVVVVFTCQHYRELTEADQVDEVAKDKWGWSGKEDYMACWQRKEAKETAEQVLAESRGAKGVCSSGSQKTEFLEEWNVKYCIKEGWKE